MWWLVSTHVVGQLAIAFYKKNSLKLIFAQMVLYVVTSIQLVYFVNHKSYKMVDLKEWSSDEDIQLGRSSSCITFFGTLLPSAFYHSINSSCAMNINTTLCISGHVGMSPLRAICHEAEALASVSQGMILLHFPFWVLQCPFPYLILDTPLFWIKHGTIMVAMAMLY